MLRLGRGRLLRWATSVWNVVANSYSAFSKVAYAKGQSQNVHSFVAVLWSEFVSIKAHCTQTMALLLGFAMCAAMSRVSESGTYLARIKLQAALSRKLPSSSQFKPSKTLIFVRVCGHFFAKIDPSPYFQHVSRRFCHRHHDFKIHTLYYVSKSTSQNTCLIAPANMISLSSNIRFERLPTKIATMPAITTFDETPTKKKHIIKTKETATVVPKTIVLPTPSTPTRYVSPTPTSTAH